VKTRDGAERRLKVTSATAMIAQDAPVFEPGDRVLDACPATTVGSPNGITEDSAPAKSRSDQLGYAAVAAVGEDAALGSA